MEKERIKKRDDIPHNRHRAGIGFRGTMEKEKIKNGMTSRIIDIEPA